MDEIDYKNRLSGYSDGELAQIRNNIDKRLVPERYKLIIEEIELRRKGIRTRKVVNSIDEKKEVKEDVLKKNGEYIPNEIPLYDRIRNIFFSLFFLISGGYGVWVNDVAVSLSRKVGRGAIYHFHNDAALVMYVALILFSLSFISEVMDHYDKRNNEHLYHRISNWTLTPGILLFILAFIIRDEGET